MAREVYLAHLSGPEIERVAKTLVGGQVDAVLNRKDEILRLDAAELEKIVAFAGATRANCGGIGCG